MVAGMNDDLLTSDIDTSSDLVTVGTFDDSVSASLVMNRLKHAGLPAVLSHENAVTWFWYLSNAIGGIVVQVNSKETENVSETENGFLPLMCPESVPDTLSALEDSFEEDVRLACSCDIALAIWEFAQPETVRSCAYRMSVIEACLIRRHDGLRGPRGRAGVHGLGRDVASAGSLIVRG